MYSLRVLTESCAMIVLSIELDFELRATLDEVCSPVLANYLLVANSEQRIGHLFDVSKSGRVSLL